MQTINERTSQAEIAKKGAIVSGKYKRQAPHPDPKGRAQVKTTFNLPLKVRKAVKNRIKQK